MAIGGALCAVAGVVAASPTYISLPFWKGSVNVAVGKTVKTRCQGDVNVISACEGDACVEVESYACVPFTCAADGLGCTATCTTTKDCGQGAACNTTRGECYSYFSTCADPYTMLAPNGQLSPCAPYRCVAGGCQQQCIPERGADCASGYTCARNAQTHRYTCKKGG